MEKTMVRTAVGVLCLGLACLAPRMAAAQTEQVYYYHLDAVGSVRMITDANGQEVERADYTPFGQPSMTGSVQDPRQFTGQPYDAETAFDYLGARYYASQTGRFTTPDDPSYLDPFNPQSMNRYAYAYNNPLRYVDLDGHSGDCVGGYDPSTGTCTPAGFDANTLRFFFESASNFAQQFMQQTAQATWGYLTAPRDPGCWAASIGAGAAAGASAGLAGLAGGPTVALSVPAASAFGGVTGGLVGATACMTSANGGSGGSGGGFKRPKAGVSAKEGAKDVPSWAKGQRPRVGESGKEFAKRLLDGKYGSGNYDKGPGSEFNQIRKWGDRAFE